MNRRRFLAAAAAARLARADLLPVRFRRSAPYSSALVHVEPGGDGFPGEKRAVALREEIERRYREGRLPLPRGNARFYVLPQDRIRYEISTPGAYRTGVLGGEEYVATAAQPLFRDVTGHAFAGAASFREQLARGVPYWRARLDAATGIDVYGNNGIAVGDIDGDGLDELYVCQPGGLPNRLYRNRGDGSFEDITERAGVGVLDDTASALFLDLRNSGRQDLVVLRADGPLLFVNRGDGTFAHAPGAFRFATPPQGAFTGMAAADYDRDGRVDLYLCSYIYFQSEDQYRYPVPYHDAQNGPPNFLFHNELGAGGGSFRDVTRETGLDHNNNRYSFAPAWCDYDGDGWPDLYVANDFGRNNLYRNTRGRFRDVAADAGVEDIGPGMSAAWFDYDGDGKPDLYVANMWTDAGQRVVAEGKLQPAEAYRRHTQGNSLYRNRGDGTFEETGEAGMGRWGWSAAAFDFDNDGAPEIYCACGMLTNSSEQDLNSFFWRQVVAKTGAEYENGWSAINQLIREDASWCGREPNVFYVRKDGRYRDYSGVSGIDFAEDSRAFAMTDFDGDGNMDIVLKSRLGPQIRALRNHCGTGRRSIAFRLEGTRSNRDAIGARVEVDGQVKFVEAGSGYLSQHTKTLLFGVAGDAGRVRIDWPSGGTQEFRDLAAGRVWRIVEGEAEPRGAPFRARAPMAGGPVAADNQPRPSAAWLLEPLPLPEKRPGPGFLILTRDELEKQPDLAAGYALFRRYLFDWRTGLDLPMTLLLNDQGAAIKFYPGIPDAALQRADRKARPAPLPFPGRYYSEPSRNYFRLGAAFFWAGYPEQAAQYLHEVVRRDANNFRAWLALGQIEFDAGRHRAAIERLDRALALRPESAQALVVAGRAHVALNDAAEAERLFLRAPASADAANQLGLLYAKQGRSGDARRRFQQAIEIQRDHSGAINNLGVLYSQLGQTGDAVAAFLYAMDVAPDDPEPYFNLGRLYVTMGDRDKAREVMRRLLDRTPDHAAARRALEDLDRR
ncbi:MAG: FG-GAP-like repeat-containing protein [Bryobacteraceae bacterium]